MLGQKFAESSMKQMRRCVIAHGGLANVSIDDGIDLVAHANRLFSDDLLRPHTLNGGIGSRGFGDDSIVIVRVKPSPVANLAAGLGVEGCPIEDYFAHLSWLKLSDLDTVSQDGKHFSLKLRGRIPHKLGVLHDHGDAAGARMGWVDAQSLA